MTLLGGIFAKRDKQNRTRSSSAKLDVPTSAVSVSSTVVSSEPDYVFPDNSSLPESIYTGPAAASSSKLKLPFRRKHLHLPHAAGTPLTVVSLNDGQRISGVVSDSGHDLPPPPPKSSIFAMYNDRKSNSAPSLPNQSNLHHSLPDTPRKSSDVRDEAHTAPPSTQQYPPNKKSGKLFSWARERTKSKPSPATVAAPSSSPAGESFNLRAFRHVRSESPAPPVHHPDAHADLPPPPARPRPRGDSAASDSSQRISVAAFREAQARRSLANSPVPSFRPPSTGPLRVENNSRKRASTVSTPTINERLPSSHRNSTVPQQLSIRSSQNSSVLDTSESDESEDEDDEEVDSDGVPIRPSRKSTITRRPGARSRSDVGHVVPNVQDERPDLPRWPKSDSVQLRQPDSMTAVRARASASTSALTPNAAARRASILAAANTPMASASEKPLPSRLVKNDNGSDSSNSDSEDMPLSALVAPRRPGSAASVSTAGSRPRMPAKPLIDIKSLVGSPPVLKPVLRHEHSVKVPSTKGKEREVDKDEPFAPPPVISLTPSHLTESPTSVASYSPTSSVPRPPTHHKKPDSDVGSIPRMSSDEPLADLNDDLMTAIKLVTSFDKVRETTPSPTQPFQKVPSLTSVSPPAVSRLANSVEKEEPPRDNRIVPTPVREYKPPAAFSVTSRPPCRYSADASQVPSPISPAATFSSVAKGTSSPQPSPIKPSFPPRFRAAVVAQQSDMQSNMSDSSSVVSTSQSSRSSRVPTVPLINAVPDSPSVRASWSSSKDLYKTRPSSAADSRISRPTSNTHISPGPSRPRIQMSPPISQSQMLTPSRPFAMRGQSPAGSSTGDSSSGLGAPFTPRDGSDLGINTGRKDRDGSDADSTLKARGRRSAVSFEDDMPRGRERVKNDAVDEGRRNQRRRNEAKAAIEFGKIVNGHKPIVHNGSDDDLVPHHGQRMSVNPIVGVDGAMPGINSPAWAPWQQQQQQQQLMASMGSMVPQFNNDASFFAAHQHAMMIAKQAYQMAVAQHAIAVAGDEWERSSNIGGGSVYGGGGGSVYGGIAGGGGSGGGMLTVPGMGIPSMMPNQWPAGPVVFPGRISSSQSEFGGGSRSVYGESFGPSMSSRSGHTPGAYGNSSSSASAYGGNARPRAKTGASQPSNTQTQASGRSGGRKIAPPSSWKSAR